MPVTPESASQTLYRLTKHIHVDAQWTGAKARDLAKTLKAAHKDSSGDKIDFARHRGVYLSPKAKTHFFARQASAFKLFFANLRGKLNAFFSGPIARPPIHAMSQSAKQIEIDQTVRQMKQKIGQIKQRYEHQYLQEGHDFQQQLGYFQQSEEFLTQFVHTDGMSPDHKLSVLRGLFPNVAHASDNEFLHGLNNLQQAFTQNEQSVVNIPDLPASGADAFADVVKHSIKGSRQQWLERLVRGPEVESQDILSGLFKDNNELALLLLQADGNPAYFEPLIARIPLKRLKNLLDDQNFVNGAKDQKPIAGMLSSEIRATISSKLKQN